MPSIACGSDPASLEITPGDVHCVHGRLPVDGDKRSCFVASAPASVIELSQRHVEVQEPFGRAPQVVIGMNAGTAVFAAPLPIVVVVDDIAQMLSGGFVLDPKLLTQ